MSDLDDLVAGLRNIEEQLRDLAYDALRGAVEGDPNARAREKKLLQARRSVERAIRALDPGPFDE